MSPRWRLRCFCNQDRHGTQIARKSARSTMHDRKELTMPYVSDVDYAEIDVAPEFVCLSFNVWGARGPQFNRDITALELENNQ